jgi:hypothetical protein
MSNALLLADKGKGSRARAIAREQGKGVAAGAAKNFACNGSLGAFIDVFIAAALTAYRKEQVESATRLAFCI